MATPTGIGAIEFEEQKRQLEILKEISDKANTLRDVMRSLNDTEAIGRFRSSLTKDLSDITSAFQANEAAAKRYIDELFNNLSTGQQKARSTISGIGKEIQDAFAPTEAAVKALDAALAGVVNGGTIDDLKTQLEGLTYKAVKATAEELKGFTQLILKTNSALVDTTKPLDENIEALKERGIASDVLIAKIIRETAAIADAEEANIKLLEVLNEYKETEGELGVLNDKARERKIKDIIALAENTAAQKKQNEEVAKRLEAETRMGQLTEISNRSRADATKGYSDLADKIFGTSKNTNLFSSSILTMISNMDPAQSGIKNLGMAIKDGLLGNMLSLEGSINRVVGFINDKLIKSTFSAADAFAKLNKETGGVAQAMGGGGAMKGFAAPELAAYGVNLEKYLDVQGKLLNNFTKFNTLGVEQQRIFTASAAKMESLGVSADQYGKLATNLYAATNKGATALAEIIDKMGRDAIGMGISVSKYLGDFGASLNKITGYGREATAIFKELEGFAKATGDALSAADIVSFTDKFNNFDEAAESLSKLNAMMGGTSLNILEMMKMDPSERMMAIKQAAAEANLEFDKLNIGYKRMLAESFGGDMAKTKAFFDLPLKEAYAMMNKTSAEAKELEERQKRSTTAQEKLNKAIDGMRIAFTPILDAVGKFADAIIALQAKFGTGGSFAIALGVLSGVAAGVWFTFKTAARAAFSEVSAQMVQLNLQISEMAIHTQQLAMAGRAGPLPALAGATPPVGGGRMMGGAGIAAVVASLALTAGAMYASSGTSDSNTNSALTTGIVTPEAPAAEDFIFNPKTGEAMRAESGAPIFITPDGQPIALSPSDSVVASKPGGGAIPQVGNTTNNNVTAAQTTANTAYTAIASTVASVKSAFQTMFMDTVGPTFAKSFVTEVVNASTSGDTKVSNIFGGGRGDVSVHVSMDSDPIAHKVITKHGDKLAEDTLSRAGRVV